MVSVSPTNCKRCSAIFIIICRGFVFVLCKFVYCFFGYQFAMNESCVKIVCESYGNAWGDSDVIRFSLVTADMLEVYHVAAV